MSGIRIYSVDEWNRLQQEKRRFARARTAPSLASQYSRPQRIQREDSDSDEEESELSKHPSFHDNFFRGFGSHPFGSSFFDTSDFFRSSFNDNFFSSPFSSFGRAPRQQTTSFPSQPKKISIHDSSTFQKPRKSSSDSYRGYSVPTKAPSPIASPISSRSTRSYSPSPSEIRRTISPEQRNDEYEELVKNKQRLLERFRLFGVREKRKIDGDGNCQFAAVADQLFSNPKLHSEVRRLAVEWLRDHPDYEVEKGVCLSDFLETECYPTWDSYCDHMCVEGIWGDHMTLIAISEVFECTIVILSSVEINNPKCDPITILQPRWCKSQRAALISHLHEHHYGSLTQEGLDS